VDQRRKIAAEMEAIDLEIPDKVRRASSTERSAWCKAAPARYESAEVDPWRNPALVGLVDAGGIIGARRDA
jgi:hypothetical protein